MNVYDFDDTIYDGDATVDFLKYMYKNYFLKIISCLPRQGISVLRYLLKKTSKEEMKSGVFSFLSRIDDVDGAVSSFWDQREGRIKQWYIDQQKADDVIISASPAFLLEEICRRRKIRFLIATDMDPHTGKITGKNCKGEEKPRRFYREFENKQIDQFYSDHPSDVFMAKLAKQAFVVKKSEIVPWENID